MVTLILSKCPLSLKGDITKWLLEISTGVYVGGISARVRELLWKKVCDYCDDGEAIMIFSAKNEQGFSFHVFNSKWKPIDYDGIVLLKKDLPIEGVAIKNRNENNNKKGKKINQKTHSLSIENANAVDSFVAIDIETTGLQKEQDNIIEIAAIKYISRQQKSSFHTLIKIDKPIPDEIIRLTGIKNEELSKKGILLKDAMTQFISFVGTSPVVGHYIKFDLSFIKKACELSGISFENYFVIDTYNLAKKYFKNKVNNYRLETLVKECGIANGQTHRALPDAQLAAELFLKLNEKE